MTMCIDCSTAMGGIKCAGNMAESPSILLPESHIDPSSCCAELVPQVNPELAEDGIP